jgi:chromosome partitioning protein
MWDTTRVEQMKILSVLSQKGGAGKTTLALHLAVAAVTSGKSVAIIDLDPQASATQWKDTRSSGEPAVVSAQAARLPQVLEAAAEAGAELSIIDTAPHSEGAALAAARSSDLILIPCRPAILDLRAISLTIDLARLAGKPAVVVLNAVPPRGALGAEAELAIGKYGALVSPTRLTQRAAFVHGLTEGLTAQEYEPEGKAAEEVRALYMWMCGQVGMSTDGQENSPG